MRSTSPALLLTIGLLACGGNGGGGDGDGDGSDVDATFWEDGRPIDAPPMVMPGSLRFFGTGMGIDRVEIAVEPHVPADVGASDFTIDFWIRISNRLIADRPLPMNCQPGRDNWRAGEIAIDRSRMAGGGDHGAFGVAVFGVMTPEGARAIVAAGVSKGTSSPTGTGVCGTHPLTLAQWHHVALTRNASTGAIQLFVDGMPDGSSNGPTGDLSYRDGATGGAKDGVLVLGADKYDTATAQSYNGFLDELRLSTTIRYTDAFTPAATPHAVDADTAALYHFDDGGGIAISDARGMSPGVVKDGQDPNGSFVPIWSISEPFAR